jgi:hypothetical protein
MLVGRLARVGPGTRMLDLASGKGEMLCRWAAASGISGHRVDASTVFVPLAVARAEELGVSGRVTFERGDAGKYQAEPRGYHVVSCLGATWIGGGLSGTIALMRPAVREDGLLLIGEPYWIDEPPPGAYPSLHIGPDEFTTLAGTLDRFEAAGLDVVEMVLADPDGWDRYMGPQWWALTEWLRAHPDDPRVPQVVEFLHTSRRSYFDFGRRYLGWGVFVLRLRP